MTKSHEDQKPEELQALSHEFTHVKMRIKSTNYEIDRRHHNLGEILNEVISLRHELKYLKERHNKIKERIETLNSRSQRETSLARLNPRVWTGQKTQ